MSIVLGIETATVEVSAALRRTRGHGLLALVLARHAARGPRPRPCIRPSRSSWRRTNVGVGLTIAAVAVDCGPGRFTGLRVGVAAAKALAFAWSVPIVIATSTELLRLGAIPTDGDPADPDSGLDRGGGVVVPVVDMRRGEVAFALPGALEPQLGAPATLGAALLAELARPILAVGDGARRYGARTRRERACPPSSSAGDAHVAPSAAVLARLGIARLARGETTDSLHALPLYLRGADVRIGWETRAPARRRER